MALTDQVDNYPGSPQGIGGAELAQLMQDQAQRFGARVELDEVVEVDLSTRPFRVKTYSQEYEAQALIIATGTSPPKLQVPGEAEFTGRGGDAAVKGALFATKVYIVHRRDQLRAEQIVPERAKRNEKVEFVWDTVVTEIVESDNVTEGRLKNLKMARNRFSLPRGFSSM